MATYAESERIRQRFMADLARLEAGATDRMAAAYVKALDRIEENVTAALEGQTTTGRAIAESFAGAEDTLRVSVIRGRADFIYGQLDRFGQDAHAAVRGLAPNAYRLGVGQARRQVKGLTGTFASPSRRTIENTLARLQDGTATADYFARFAVDQTREAVDALTTGVVLGENPLKIAQRMRGRLDMAQSRVRTVARTEVMTAARAGLGDSYRDNADVLSGWVWNAEESASTCEVCWAMNGTVHDLGEDLDSHPNCRCVQTPITRTFDEIIGADTGVAETSADGFDPDERFADVLTPDEQIKVLGPSKYALWSDGRINLADLAVPTSHPEWGPGLRATTLRELRAAGVEDAPVMDRVARARRGRRR